jgi:hypothetical protein
MRTYTHAQALKDIRFLGFLHQKGMIIPSPLAWAYRRGYTPYLADFVVVALLETFFKLFLWVHFLVRVWFPYYCMCVLCGTWANIPPSLFSPSFSFCFCVGVIVGI